MFKKIAISLIALAAPLTAAEFEGWESMRVIQHEGTLSVMEKVDVYGDGREALLLMNRKQSKIDIYRWLKPSERKKAKSDPTRPNDIPMANDFVREEINFDRLPLHLKAAELDNDKTRELLITTTNPLKLHRYDYQKGKWENTATWKLMDERIHRNDMLIYQNKVYLSCVDGVQVIELKKGAKPQWMLPREKNTSRLNWWLSDINKDGKKDLIELISTKAGTVRLRWSEGQKGSFLPALPLGDIAGERAMFSDLKEKQLFYFMNAVRRKTVSAYEVAAGEESAYGHNRLLPTVSATSNLRTSVKVDGKDCLLELTPAKPQMRMSQLSKSGFSVQGTFPVIRNTVGIVSPVGSDVVLLQTKNGQELYKSKWENGRFSFPKPFVQAASKESKKILNMRRQANVVWWAQAVGADLHMYFWKEGTEKPDLKIYPKVATNASQVQWLGGTNIMLRKKYAKFAEFYRLSNSKAEKFEASDLKDATPEQLRLLPQGVSIQLLRLVDGIVQKLDNNLQVTDQVMLENDKRIIDCIAVGKSKYLVLDSTTKKLRLLSPNNAGLMKETENFDIISGTRLDNDPLLGLVVFSKSYLNAPLSGKSLTLKLFETVDSNTGLPEGDKKGNIHNFDVLDVTGKGQQQLVLFDYSRHQLTIVEVDKDKTESIASWKVFDDGKYPYGDNNGVFGSNRSPYGVFSIDFEGDGKQDLVLPCHERLVFYLGKESK